MQFLDSFLSYFSILNNGIESYVSYGMLYCSRDLPIFPTCHINIITSWYMKLTEGVLSFYKDCIELGVFASVRGTLFLCTSLSLYLWKERRVMEEKPVLSHITEGQNENAVCAHT